jgi:hypothetical protein
MRPNKSEAGNTFVELAFLVPILVSLYVGVFQVGIRLAKELALAQVTRDAASMYARGVDFSTVTPSNQALLSRLGTLLQWPQTSALKATDPGVVYFSRIMFIDSTCNGLASSDSKGRACNKNSWVFLNTVVVGNTGLHGSNFGAPPACAHSGSGSCYESVISGSSANNGDINVTEAYYNPQDKVTNFTYLGTPATGTSGFQPGQPANLVEAAAGSTLGTNYFFALF